jgi:hypothetical protein
VDGHRIHLPAWLAKCRAEGCRVVPAPASGPVVHACGQKIEKLTNRPARSINWSAAEVVVQRNDETSWRLLGSFDIGFAVTFPGSAASEEAGNMTTGAAPSQATPAPSGKAETPTAAGTGAQSRRGTVNLPFVTAQFHKPNLRIPRPNLRVPRPNRAEMGAALHTARGYLPSPKTALYYGGLVVLVGLEAIEWPVAAAIGVGTAIAGGRGRGDQPRQATAPAATSGTAPATASGTAPTATSGTAPTTASGTTTAGAGAVPQATGEPSAAQAKAGDVKPKATGETPA